MSYKELMSLPIKDREKYLISKITSYDSDNDKSLYNKQKWKKIRFKVLKRDILIPHKLCRLNDERIVIHHINPITSNSTELDLYSLDNLIALDYGYHTWIHRKRDNETKERKKGDL